MALPTIYLYVILDIYSRWMPEWMIAEQQTESLAKKLIEETGQIIQQGL